MRRILLVVAALALALAGCGTTEHAAGDRAAAGAPTGASITVTDARGTPITLAGPATRVVGLEWNVVEHAVSLGVMPVGVADITGYGKWVTAEPLDASVRDVGVRGEPSIDTIAALRPDVILATDELPEAAVTQMQAFAPVVFVAGGRTADPIAGMRANVELIATVLGKQAEATAMLAAFDAKLAAGAAALTAKAGRPFLFADGYVEGSQLSIRPFTTGSLLSAVTERLGMVNAWTGEGDPAYGLAQTDVEGLTRVGDVDFFYIVNDADGGNPFGEQLATNPVWTSLPFVQTGKVHRVPDGIWMFGGPTSMDRYVDAVVAAVGS